MTTKLSIKYDITENFKHKENMLKTINIDGLIAKNKSELLAHQQKIEEIENKLSLLNININEDKYTGNFINKRDGKLIVSIRYPEKFSNISFTKNIWFCFL